MGEIIWSKAFVLGTDCLEGKLDGRRRMKPSVDGERRTTSNIMECVSVCELGSKGNPNLTYIARDASHRMSA